MKKIVFIIIYSLFIYSFDYAQSCSTPQNSNNEFSIITSSCGSSPTCIGETCAQGWFASHGSPDIKGSGGGAGVNGNTSNYAFMWAKAPNSSTVATGEGLVYNGYSFVAGNTYTITIQSAGNFSSTIAGYRVFATTGLSIVAPPTSDCYFIPTPTTSQEIPPLPNRPQTNVSTNDNRSFTFTANATYSQLWIYPFYTTIDAFHGQFEWTVDYVNICQVCPGNLTYNSGTLPTGDTKGNIINVGSTTGTGGSGTVNNDVNAYTTLIASQEINFLPEFFASANFNLVEQFEFNAKIVPCTLGSSEARSQSLPRQNLPTYSYRTMNNINAEDSLNMVNPLPLKESITLEVFPNPITAKTQVRFTSIIAGTIEINILNTVGSIVYHTICTVSNNKTGKNQIELDLSKLSSGAYVLQLKNKNGSALSQKIIKL